jgi:mono/diheme cytochrome c family protein/glucose/arabinose dehydrogenase
MFPSRFRIVALLLWVTAATGYGYQGSQSGGSWPPGVQAVPADAPALSPADAIKTFSMPPGYRIELVASEPLIQDPVAMDWDTEGRLWAVEMPGFVQDLAAPEPNFDPIGRVVVLEDTNGDGAMDSRTVFADGLVLARSLKVLDRGLLVAEPPHLWLMRDTDGDLRMDTKEVVTDLYGRREARVEQNASDLHWGLDNWIHTAYSDIVLRFRNGRFEAQKTLERGEWGVTHDDAGRIYRNTNESALHVDFVPTPYYMRNPNLVRTRGSYDALRDDDNAVNTVWPVRPNPGTNRAYQTGIDRPDGSLARFTSASAPLVYRGDRLPADLYGNVFVAEPAANLVGRLILSDDGTTLRARKAYERGEFLASTDERFRPVFLSNAPDGTLYIVDMYRGVIQQRADITQYLRDYILAHKLERPTGLGRIYRVVHDTTRRDTARGLAKRPPSQLVTALSHPNGWWRDTAQQLLVERGDKSIAPELMRLAGTAADWRTRLHALWTLDGLEAVTPALVTSMLEDASRDVRVSAIRIAERWLADAAQPVQGAVLKRLDDPDWAVRQQLAASLGGLPSGRRESALASLLDRYAADPVVMDAALSGVRGSETALLEKLMERGPAQQTPQRQAALTMTAATIVRGTQESAVQKLFESIAGEALPSWVRDALLRGAEVALLGTTAPGSSEGRRGGLPAAQGLPCPTCPGGRAGPGGAYAFPQTPPAAAGADAARGSRPAPPSGSRGRGGMRTVRVNSEPARLSQLAGAGSELSARARAVLARVEWPGKPGSAAPVAPLTPEQQQRFDAGQEIYRNVCQACHQPDGRGQERLAATLIGSPLVLGPAEIPARILLHGKEGPVGLMPPVGQLFTDAQLAAVLTYIRREWGQDGDPVDEATVKSVRAATAGRTRPWTDAELTALGGSGRGQRPGQ